MSIAFTCPRCRKSYSVDASLAGRTGKCKACGRPMTIPHFFDDGDDTIATEGYDLTQPVVAAAEPEMQSVFVPAGINPEVPNRARRRRTASSPSGGRSRREEEKPFFQSPRRFLVAIPLVLVGVLGLTALIVPNGTLIDAWVLMGLGGLMIFIGYFVGAWAAFHEDSLYGFAYIFPLYAAYYLVTRWEDLWPWFVAMTVGVGLITLGATIAESKLRDEPVPAAARIEAVPRVFSFT